MRTLLTSFVAAAMLCAASCDKSDRVLLPHKILKPDVADGIIMLDDPFNAPFPKDDVTIEGASIEGDLLTLDVAYGGGCRTHQFRLYGSNGFMESYPVQARVILSHNANGDHCEALIRHDIVFDLSPLKQSYQRGYQDDGPVLLRITGPGTDEPLRPLPVYEL